MSERTPCAPTPEAVVRVVARARLRLSTEAATQADLEEVLVAAFGRAAVSREHRLAPGERPDFLIAGGTVIEVKSPRARAAAVLRQLERYAAYDEVEALILASARAVNVPARIGGKPGRFVNLGMGWL